MHKSAVKESVWWIERYASCPGESAEEDMTVVVNPKGGGVESLSKEFEMSTHRVMGWELKVPLIP